MASKGNHGRKSRSGTSNQLRVIGGTWRGRRLDFPDSKGLRPTSDRLRETLFNWLQWALPGSHCLDLFAGSGALGFEAVSRGASEVVLVEALPQVAKYLRENAIRLGANRIHILNERADVYLRGTSQLFDIVFLDPPYGEGLLEPTLYQLVHGDWLRPGAYVYLEHESDRDPLVMPAGLSISRMQRAGRAIGLLARWKAGDGTVADR